MKHDWNIIDIIDLDYYSKVDAYLSDYSAENLHLREREWYMKASEAVTNEIGDHSSCLRIWLQEMRELHHIKAKSGPGALFVNLFTAFRLGVIVLAIMSGIVLGRTCFAYDGTAALNIFFILSAFILPQFLWLLLFLNGFFWVKFKQKDWTEMQKVLPALFQWFNGRVQKWKAEQFNFSYLDVKLLGTKMLACSHLFGVFFNAALLGVTTYKITTSDLAFGWQTTLQFGSETLFSLAKIVAIPWSWIFPEGTAYPTLEQIEGSRIILKDGIFGLVTENLISWWPFLLLCLFFYGLLPRLILLGTTLFMEKRNLQQFLYKDVFKQICQRMQTPIVTTQAEPEPQFDNSKRNTIDENIRSTDGLTVDGDDKVAALAPDVTNDTADGSYPEQNTPDESIQSLEYSTANGDDEVIVLIPDEIIDAFDEQSLQTTLSRHGYKLGEKKPIFAGFTRDEQLLTWLRSEKKNLVILIEAWMAPIREQLLFLKNVIESTAPSGKTGIILLGKPNASTPLTKANQQDSKIWKSQIVKIGRRFDFFQLELAEDA